MTKLKKKTQNILLLNPFCQNLGENELSTKIEHFQFYNPLKSCKKIEKNNEPNLRKTLK